MAIIITKESTLEDILRKERVLMKYKSNIINVGKRGNIIESFLKSKSIRRLLGSFTWSDTKEGYVFWRDIYIKYRDL